MGNLWTTENFPEWSDIPSYTKIIGTSVIGALTLILILRKFTNVSKRSEYPKDTVILHQIGRGPWAPSMSPFAVKLETYLRMANIPYQNVHSQKTSSKGKVPWMEYNGESIADSQFCIEYLNKLLKIDMNKHLTDEQRGIGRALQKMAEENTYWTLALFRWYYDPEMRALSAFKVPIVLKWLIKRWVRKDIKATAEKHGIGRHSKEEQNGIMMGDLRAFSDFLGKKKYLFGDTPCEMDCGIFGQLSELYWHTFGNPSGTAIKEFPNLCDYCERMKDTFWPDWDDCITHGGTREATK